MSALPLLLPIDAAMLMPVHGGAEWEARTATQSVHPLIAISNPKEHLRRRKPWNRALNVASLKDLEPLIANRAEQLVSLLAVSDSRRIGEDGTTNLGKWFSWFS